MDNFWSGLTVIAISLLIAAILFFLFVGKGNKGNKGFNMSRGFVVVVGLACLIYVVYRYFFYTPAL